MPAHGKASLRDKGVLALASAPLDQAASLRFSAQGAPTTAAPVKGAVAAQASSKQSGGKTLIGNRWQPDDELLRQLALHGISRDFALAQVDEFVLYWSDRGDPAYSWNAKFRSHVIRRWREHEAATAEPDERPRPIRADWRPDPDALEILERAEVARQFIEDAIPEFLLYWTERGEVARTWNSRFVTHVKRQWARYTATMELDGEPRRIALAWQPSGDVFDILRMANIDHDFARALIREFVLYWSDSGEAHVSWNSKFLQHVKIQWARSRSGAGTAEQANADRQGTGGTRSAPNIAVQRRPQRPQLGRVSHRRRTRRGATPSTRCSRCSGSITTTSTTRPSRTITAQPAKKLWLESLAEFPVETILQGARRCIEGSEFLPTLNRMREVLPRGAPRRAGAAGRSQRVPRGVQCARAACGARVVARGGYHAGLATGWRLLTQAPEKTAYPLFEQNYHAVCARLIAGDTLALPAPPAASDPSAAPDFDAQRAALKKLREATGL